MINHNKKSFSMKVSRDPADYPNFGLNHTPQHLKDIADKIAFFPIEKQAEYADAICRAMIDNHERHVEDFEFSSISDNGLSKFNATSIGNIAYTAMNSSSVKEVRNALKILELFKEYKTRMKNQRKNKISYYR